MSKEKVAMIAVAAFAAGVLVGPMVRSAFASMTGRSSEGGAS